MPRKDNPAVYGLVSSPRGFEYFFWIIVSLLAVIAGVVLWTSGLAFLLVVFAYNFSESTLLERALVLHFFAGPLCILIGTFQALRGFKNRNISKMRWGSAVSVLAILIMIGILFVLFVFPKVNW
jgi:hypothetical protein